MVDHTRTECDDNSLIFMLSFSVFVVHIKKTRIRNKIVSFLIKHDVVM